MICRNSSEASFRSSNVTGTIPFALRLRASPPRVPRAAREARPAKRGAGAAASATMTAATARRRQGGEHDQRRDGGRKLVFAHGTRKPIADAVGTCETGAPSRWRRTSAANASTVA